MGARSSQFPNTILVDMTQAAEQLRYMLRYLFHLRIQLVFQGSELEILEVVVLTL